MNPLNVRSTPSAPTYLVLPWNLAYIAAGIGMLALAVFGVRRGKAPEPRGTRGSAAALAMLLLAGLLAGKVQWHGVWI